MGLGRASGDVAAADSPDRAAEIQAREAFAAGRFDEALNRFAKLYAQTLHPVYLRNIGRCHQKMREPQKAIDAFHDYLAKGRNISGEERAEIEAYIREMQLLVEQQRKEQDQERERERAARFAAQPPPAAEAAAGAPARPVLALGTPVGDPNPAAMIVGGAASGGDRPPAPSRADEGATPVYKQWWFWTAVGVVAVGAGATVFLLTRGEDCPRGVTCQ